MSMVKDIADFIAAAGLGTVATNIFCGDIPDAPDAVTCVFEYAGEQPLLGETIDQPGLQILVRNLVYETARTQIQSIQNLLMRVGDINDVLYYDGVVLNTKDYLRIVPAQGISSLGKDSKNRTELVQNFYVVKRR